MNDNDKMTSQIMVDMRMDEYNSDDRHEQVLTHIENLKVKEHMKTKESTNDNK